MPLRLIASLFFGISLISTIIPTINVLAETEQKIDLLANEIVWVAWGVFIAAGSAIATIVFDIYDRHKQNKAQILELVRSYGQQLTDLMDKERRLSTKKDCETYAMSYLDLMDQIAYLYEQGSMPQTVARYSYFGNNFSYAKSMLKWIKANNVVLPKDIDETWIDLVNWCAANKIDEFDDDQLPDAMQKYDSLPDEDITGLLEVVRGYSKQLTDLMYNERTLITKLDCELYAIAYLDLMDQIAFLYSKGSIPKDIAVYFENNFEHAMTLLDWIEKKKDTLLPKNDDSWKGKWTGPWTDLVQWCEKQVPKIEASGDINLPDAMQNYGSLPDK